MTVPRTHLAQMKVIALGLGRTGTTSLHVALEILGLGPCYDFTEIIAQEGRDLEAWSKIGDGDKSPEAFDNILRDYHSVVDVPAALYPAELYAAYPDAKFILMTRDPVKWERSMRATILRIEEVLDPKPVKTPFEEILLWWHKKYLLDKYHRGRLYTHTQQELLDHNERVRKIIPKEKLLVYEVSEGWDKLVEFLGVPKPTQPFPHVNTSGTFEAALVAAGNAR